MCISFGANAFKAIQLWGLAGGYESIVDKGTSTIYRYLFDAVTSSALLDTLPPRDITVYERNSEVNEFELPFALKPLNVSANGITIAMTWKCARGLSKVFKTFSNVCRSVQNNLKSNFEF